MLQPVYNIFEYLKVPLQPSVFFQPEPVDEWEIKRVIKNIRKLQNIFDFDLDKWQEACLIAMVVKNEEERYIFNRLTFSIPRQEGKSYLLRIRILYGMIFEYETILATGHTTGWSVLMFDCLKELLTQNKNTLSFLDYARNHTRTSQDEIIIKLKTDKNAITRFKTRGYTANAIRGKTADVVVLDEVQLLNKEQSEAIAPVTTASRNPQTINIGTPTTPTDLAKGRGEIFYNQRKQAKRKKLDGFYADWGIPSFSIIKKPASWKEYLPAVAEGRIHIDNIRSLRDSFENNLAFARECLGGWFELDVKATTSEITKKQWRDLTAEKPKEKYKGKFGALSFGSQKNEFALSVCYTYENKEPFVDVVYTASYDELYNGKQTPEEILADIIDKAEFDLLAIDMKQNAYGLTQKLKTKTIFPAWDKTTKTGEFYIANSEFLSAVKYKKLTHPANEVVDKLIPMVTKKIAGKNSLTDVKWVLTLPENSEIIKSLVLALWCSTKKKETKIKLYIS